MIAGLKKPIATHLPVVFREHISLDVNQVISMLPSDYRLFTVSDATGELGEGVLE